MGAQESKLSFRRGIFRLHEERNIPKDDAYWESYWTLPESAEDIFTLFSATDIRKTRDEAPENLKTLIQVVCHRLFQLRHDPRFPSEEAPERQMLNCMRILTRTIPFLFEDGSFNDHSVGLFWAINERLNQDNTQDGRDADKAETLEGIQVDRDEDVKGGERKDNSWKAHGDDENAEPIAEELTRTLIELLFFCDFTIPANYGKEKVVYGIWETGVGCTVPMGTTKQFESNKIETLRCLLALCSRGMYVPANEERGNRHVTHLVMMIPKNVVLALLCSLINTTMKFNPTTWRTIPYSSTFLTDSRQLLVSYSLQFLLIVLCYPLPPDGQELYSGYTPEGEAGPVNQFVYYFKKLHRANDFNFMVEGMSRVLHQPLSASSSYLPGSQKPVRFYPEVLLFFWESLQQNRRFRNFLVETDRALDFLVVLVFYALQNKSDSAQIGLVRMCVFILQPLSAEPKFAKSLNKLFEGQASLPATVRIPSFAGSYADFLIVNIYNLIATSKGQLSSLYSALFMTLSNIAPHIKNMSVMASTKLIQLFTSISQPSFLFANDSNFRLLQYLLEVLNGVIEHNFKDNPHLIYAILRSHERFEALQELTLASGIETFQRAQESRRRKEETARTETASATGETQPAGGKIDDSASSLGDDQSDREQDKIASSDLSSKSNTVSQSTGPRSTSGDGSVNHSRKSSLSSDMDFPPPSPRVMSEKAKGKLPEGAQLHRQSSTTSIRSVSSLTDRMQYNATDSNFEPSGEWFEKWYPDLDLGPVVTVLDQLAPEVTKLSQETPDPRPIIKYLQRAEIQGLIPRTPNPRTFVWSEQAKVWFESLLFGYIYVSETQIGNGAVGVWTGTHVKLFRVQSDPSAEDPNLIFRISNSVDGYANQLASKLSGTALKGVSNTTAVVDAPDVEPPTPDDSSSSNKS